MCSLVFPILGRDMKYGSVDQIFVMGVKMSSSKYSGGHWFLDIIFLD